MGVVYTVYCASIELVVYYVLSLGKTQMAQLRSVLNRRESNTMRDGIATLSGGAIVGSHTPPDARSASGSLHALCMGSLAR